MKTNERNKVLIALDYNPTSQKVAEEGYAIAKAMHADVVLLHVVSDTQYYSSVEYSPIMGFGGFMDIGATPLNADSLKEASQHFLNKTRNHLKDNTIKTLVSEGDLADSIAKNAKDLHANVIVLGSHSRRWLEEILMGSVTEKVLRHSTVPVLIIPTSQKKVKPFLTAELLDEKNIPSN